MNAFWAEFVGTFLLIFIGNGVVANVVLKDTKGGGDPGSWIMITSAWGFAVFVGVVVAGPYSGAHLNPVVTLALWLDGALEGSQNKSVYVGSAFGSSGWHHDKLHFP